MNIFQEALPILQTSWCKGHYRQTLPPYPGHEDVAPSFCAIGAIAEVLHEESGVSFSDATIAAEEHNDLWVLAEVIKDNYPAPADDGWGWSPSTTVIRFNDYVANHADEVVKVFELAAEKLERESVKVNKLEQAAALLRKGWCKGSYREDLPEGTSFCATGAMIQTFAPELTQDNWDGLLSQYSDSMPLTNALSKVERSNELRVLAGVISDNYPDDKLIQGHMASNHWFSAVVSFNDFTANSADEVVAMFEKAAIKYDEYSGE